MAVLIFGTGDFAEVLYEKLRAQQECVDGFVINEKYITDRTFSGLPVLPYEHLKKCLGAEEKVAFYLAVIGKKSMFQQREEVYQRIKADGYEIKNFISNRAIVQTEQIGDGNIIMENVVIEQHCVLGNGNIIWPNVVLPHHNRVGSFNNLSPSASFSGYATVENHCFVGNNACLNNRVQVHDRALVGAGVFAAHDVPAESVLVSSKAYLLEGRKSWEFK